MGLCRCDISQPVFEAIDQLPYPELFDAGMAPLNEYDFLLALTGAACCKPPSLKVSACLARHSLLPRLPAAPSFDLAEVLHISPKNLWTISDSSFPFMCIMADAEFRSHPSLFELGQHQGFVASYVGGPRT